MLGNDGLESLETSHVAFRLGLLQVEDLVILIYTVHWSITLDDLVNPYFKFSNDCTRSCIAPFYLERLH